MHVVCSLYIGTFSITANRLSCFSSNRYKMVRAIKWVDEVRVCLVAVCVPHAHLVMVSVTHAHLVNSIIIN